MIYQQTRSLYEEIKAKQKEKDNMNETKDEKEEQTAIKDLNIYQKLVEVRKGAVYVKKNAEGYKFKYATGSDFIGSLRAKMDEMNLILVPNMDEFEVVPYLKTAQALKVKISYTWVNADKPHEQLMTSYTFIEDKMTGCQGIGSLMTYCERYYLCKFFQIATSEDDPEKYYKKHGLSPRIDEVREAQEQPRDEVIEAESLSKERKELIVSFWLSRGGAVRREVAEDFLEKCCLVFQKEPQKLSAKLMSWEQSEEAFIEAYKKYEKKFIEAQDKKPE
jgi:hypothetical protein